MKLSALKNDVSTEDDGIWMPLPTFPSVRAKVRCLASDAVQRARKRAIAQFKVEAEWKGEDAHSVARRARAQECQNLRMLRAAIAEIDGITDDEGNPLSLADIADELFADPPPAGTEDDLAAREWRYLRTDLWTLAAQYDTEAQAALAEAGKELPPASAVA